VGVLFFNQHNTSLCLTLQHKETPVTTTPSYETKALTNEMANVFEEYKATHQQAEKNSDPLLEDKLNRMNDKMDKMQEQMQQMTIAQQRTPAAAPADPLTIKRSREREAFNLYLRKGVVPAELKAMSATTDVEGGYAVVNELSATMCQVLRDSSPIRQLATVVEVSSEAFEMLADPNDVGSAWTTETGARNETSTADLGKIRIPTFELYAEPRITQKLIDDARFDVETWLANKVADRFARVENTAFISGTGVTQPRGITTYPAGTTFGTTIERVKTGVSGNWPAANPADVLLDLTQLLKISYANGAAFLLNRSLMSDVRKFKGSDGQYIWQPSYQAGHPALLLGYPVYIAEDMPNKSASSVSVAFGNFRLGYTVVDRIGTRVLRDPFTAKPYVKFYTTKRVGGDVTNTDAIKLLEFSV
jgi:HK97 family phage major capsid protein